MWVICARLSFHILILFLSIKDTIMRIWLLVCFGTCSILKSQILNIDREVTDSMPKYWYGLISGSLSQDKQKFDIQDISLYTESVIKRKNGTGITYVGQVDATVSGKQILQNEGYFQLKHRDLDKRKSSLEYFLQYQWNGAWGMQSRALVGLNLRKRLFEEKGYDLYLGVGGFVQNEIWNYNGVVDATKIPLNPTNVIDQQLRLNTYLKGAIKLSSKCDLVCQTYVQSDALSLIDNPKIRWYWSSEIVYNLTENWMLGFNYDHTYNQSNPVPIGKYYYGYTMNLSFKF
jgi:hypothetical protein